MVAKLTEGPVKESEVLKIIKAALREDGGAKQVSMDVSTTCMPMQTIILISVKLSTFEDLLCRSYT